MMSRGRNIISSTFNKPQLITVEDFQPIADFLSNPERVKELSLGKKEKVNKLTLEDFNNDNHEYNRYLMQDAGVNPDTLVGKLRIEGVLVYRSGEMDAHCVELTSYEKLKNTFELQVNLGMKTCILYVDSGGGQAHSCFSTAQYVRQLATEKGVKLVTYVDGSACSAAYCWASIADEVIAHEQSSVGSIGVLIQLYNDSKMLENIGIERSFVFAGGNKIPYDKNGEFTNDFIDRLQRSVNRTYSMFVKHVSEMRNLSEESVMQTNASVFDADEALFLGLIDKIMTLEEFDNYVLDMTSNKSTGYSQYLTDVSPVEEQSLNNNHKETVTMTDKTVKEAVLENVVEQVEQASVAPVQDSQLADLQEKLTTLSADFSAKQEAFELLASEKGEIEKQLASAQEQVKQLTSQLDAIKLSQVEADRKAKLENVLGTENDQVATLLSTTMALDDVAFGAIVSALEAKVEKEDKELNTEVGNSANQDTTPPDYNAALKAQFSKK